MKARPRLRKTVKWSGAALTALLVFVWIGSGWYCLDGASPTIGDVAIGGGRLFVLYPPRSAALAWHRDWNLASRDSSSRLRFRWRLLIRSSYVAVPLWLPTLPVLLVTAFAWRADAQARAALSAGCCSSCGYDRAGLPASAPCPECGAKGGKGHEAGEPRSGCSAWPV